MNDLELMQELQNMVKRLNNAELNERDYQLISLIIIGVTNELVNKAFDLVLSITKD